MKRIAFIALVSTLAAAGTSLATAASSPDAAPRPSIRLIDTEPLTVRGANFKAGEQVTVTASTRENAKIVNTRRASRATGSGSFTVALPGAHIPSCAQWSVTARGASGTHATIKIVPVCGPAPVAR